MLNIQLFKKIFFLMLFNITIFSILWAIPRDLLSKKDPNKLSQKLSSLAALSASLTSLTGVTRIDKHAKKKSKKALKAARSKLYLELIDEFDDEFITKLILKKIDLQVPKVINYIWLGGPIYESYWNNITKMATIAKANGYVVQVWVDNYKNLQTLKTDPQRLKLKDVHLAKILVSNSTYDHYVNKFKLVKVSTIELLESRTRELKKFPSNFFKEFWKLVRNEMQGLKNYAAASDLLRYLILFIDGGIYLDTDTIIVSPSVGKIPNIGDIELEFGFKRDSRANSILLAIKEHPIMFDSVLSSIEQLLNLSSKYFQRKRTFLAKGHLNKRNLTIGLTGPGLLNYTLRRFDEKLKAKNYHMVKLELDLEYHPPLSDIYKIGDELLVQQQSDQTWLRGKDPRYVE